MNSYLCDVHFVDSQRVLNQFIFFPPQTKHLNIYLTKSLSKVLNIPLLFV